jgi:hypothetical protein
MYDTHDGFKKVSWRGLGWKSVMGPVKHFKVFFLCIWKHLPNTEDAFVNWRDLLPIACNPSTIQTKNLSFLAWGKACSTQPCIVLGLTHCDTDLDTRTLKLWEALGHWPWSPILYLPRNEDLEGFSTLILHNDSDWKYSQVRPFSPACILCD